MLGKILKIGGLENIPPKTSQNTDSLRQGVNVIPSNNDTLIPRYDWEAPSGQEIDIRNVEIIANYDGQPLRIQDHGNPTAPFLELDKSKMFLGNTLVPKNCYTGLVSSDYELLPSQAMRSYRVNNTVYFLGYGGAFTKYDGVEWGYAGVPQPIFGTDDYLAAGTRFIRVVQHTYDFDRNEPVSEYVQFTTNSISLTLQTNNYLAGGYISLPANLTNVQPKDVYSSKTNSGNYFIGTAAFSGADLVVTTTDTNISTERIGSYVFLAGTQSEMVTMGFTEGQRSIALKVKSIGVGTITLSGTDAKILTLNREWESTTVSGGTFSAAVKYGTRTFFTVWEALSETGLYYFRAIHPSFPDSIAATTVAPARVQVATTAVATSTAGSADTMFLMSPILNSWYAVNSRKVSPNYYGYFGNETFQESFYCMTKYQGQILLANDNFVYFSDTTLGGWIEQFNSANVLLVGDKEYGRITCIEATNDFLLVCRERRNYYVTGNIATGNYRIQELSDTPVGAWCANSAFSIDQAIIFLTSVGVYRVGVGGNCSKVSESFTKNFNAFDSLSLNENITFLMTGTVSDLNVSGSGISVNYDAYRNLLVFMKRETGNPCLVVSPKSGNFYEWSGMLTGYPNVFANCIQFIAGAYYLGGVDISESPYTRSALYVVENKTLLRSYLTTHPAKIFTTWLTNGEPSLEKEILQLKIFGRISATSTYGLKIKHYKDWNINTLVTDTEYFPQTTAAINSQIQYSHKKRLNSDKCLAVSIGIEAAHYTVDFEIESLEVEFNSIQIGVKK